MIRRQRSNVKSGPRPLGGDKALRTENPATSVCRVCVARGSLPHAFAPNHPTSAASLLQTVWTGCAITISTWRDAAAIPATGETALSQKKRDSPLGCGGKEIVFFRRRGYLGRGTRGPLLGPSTRAGRLRSGCASRNCCRRWVTRDRRTEQNTACGTRRTVAPRRPAKPPSTPSRPFARCGPLPIAFSSLS